MQTGKWKSNYSYYEGLARRWHSYPWYRRAPACEVIDKRNVAYWHFASVSAVQRCARSWE